jgi:hypothetical protein
MVKNIERINETKQLNTHLHTYEKKKYTKINLQKKMNKRMSENFDSSDAQQIERRRTTDILWYC